MPGTTRLSVMVLAFAIGVGGCAPEAPLEGASCDLQHACPSGFACIDGVCMTASRCDPRTGYCLSCNADGTCSVTGVCDERELCVGCLTDTDCPMGVCLPQSRICVGCRLDADCATNRCLLPEHICAGCKSDSQCASGQCEESSGRCLESVSLKTATVEGL